MNIAQRAAYFAICEADRECVCPLAIEFVPTSEKHCWGEAFSVANDLMIASALVTDHLHTRHEDTKFEHDGLVARIEKHAGGWLFRIENDLGDTSFLISNPSKLSVHLAAHIIRLNLDRSLISAMEEPND